LLKPQVFLLGETQRQRGKKNFIQEENHSTKAIIDDITATSASDHNFKKTRSRFLSIKNSNQKYFSQESNNSEKEK